MRWEHGRRSDNVEDRRGLHVSRRGLAGGGIGALILALVAIYFGVDPAVVLNQAGTLAPAQESQQPAPASPEEERQKAFLAVVLADTEDVWGALFSASGQRYEQPRLVLFSGAAESACGFAESAVGPFYCPADGKLYLDLSFFADLERRLGAPGDFAQAYVIAHEVGHHVQNLLGLADRVTEAQRRARSQEQVNELSVRMELQADCLAGVWGHSAAGRGILEAGDVEEGLRAAAAIGDDRMQHMAQGRISPESWTHGSSEMRVAWLRRGLEGGDPDHCDTFAAGTGG